jgi:hypothetical protein
MDLFDPGSADCRSAASFGFGLAPDVARHFPPERRRRSVLKVLVRVVQKIDGGYVFNGLAQFIGSLDQRLGVATTVVGPYTLSRLKTVGAPPARWAGRGLATEDVDDFRHA